MTDLGIPYMTKKITSFDEAKRLIQAKRYSEFTFPTLEISFEYRKPDILKLAYNGHLPAQMAEAVIRAYKLRLSGGDTTQFEKELADTEVSDELLKELTEKGYLLLKDLGVTYKFLNVGQSDIDNGIFAWADVPENDAIAFLLHLLNDARNAEVEDGGEMSEDDITSFPDAKRGRKRNTVGKAG